MNRIFIYFQLKLYFAVVTPVLLRGVTFWVNYHTSEHFLICELASQLILAFGDLESSSLFLRSFLGIAVSLYYSFYT